ncbi:homeobox protein 2-like isoform X2 [Ceratina calcarata]|uniref:Homeobox protein 2-like isoform X2 n=1 Tax=Ceratina calcarata TaxID=156304 RepID=A0AAJ7J8S2_9HYME|nr:homeobox protein 2-like isoform X2 [Ceratina calcarata]
MSIRLLKDPATVSSRIFVGHLQTDDMTKHELEEHFSKYGTVIGSLIHRGFGFVQFEEEQSAQKAIQNEDGAMFKGRRIDVRPAKKDNQSGGGSGGPKQMAAVPDNQFNSGSNHFNASNDSFNSGNPNFGGNPNFNANQNFSCDPQLNDNQKPNIQNRGGGSDQFSDGNQNRDSGNDQFGNQNRNNVNDQFNNIMQNKGNNNFMPNNQNRGGGEQFNQNRGGNQFGPGGNQNRPGNNQNRNANNQNQGSGGNSGTGGGRQRGTRGGKNRNKNRDNSGGNNNFRDRSPINRNPGRLDEKSGRDWDHKQGDRLRGNNFARESFNDTSNRYEDFKSPAPRDMNMSFNNTTSSGEYTNTTTEKNDCEIIVVNKSLTEYAESIEMRLKKIGLTVDLLFPNEDVLLSRVLGNIASRGCLYAVVVTPVNQEHHSLTLNILHGLPQEHRNMPVDDAINLMSRDFTTYKAGARSVPLNTPFANERHPDAIQVLLNMLADNHQLTVLQYDRVIKYLEIKREEQVQVELGDAKDLPTTTPTITVSDPKQAELQSRILNILNSNKTNSSVPVPSPVPAPTAAPTPVPPATWGAAASTVTTSTTTTATGVAPSPLLNDPTVQKALDSLLQGNLLKSISDQQPATTTTPLFAAFSNIGRF